MAREQAPLRPSALSWANSPGRCEQENSAKTPAAQAEAASRRQLGGGTPALTMPAPAALGQTAASEARAAAPGNHSPANPASQISKTQMRKALKKGWWARRRNGSGTENDQQKTQRTEQFQPKNPNNEKKQQVRRTEQFQQKNPQQQQQQQRHPQQNNAKRVTFQFNGKSKGKGTKGGNGRR